MKKDIFINNKSIFKKKHEKVLDLQILTYLSCFNLIINFISAVFKEYDDIKGKKST